MGQASASSSASSAIQAPGGSIIKQTGNVWLFALLAAVLIVWLWRTKKG